LIIRRIRNRRSSMQCACAIGSPSKQRKV
jgi:hypothetical protein